MYLISTPILGESWEALAQLTTADHTQAAARSSSPCHDEPDGAEGDELRRRLRTAAMEAEARESSDVDALAAAVAARCIGAAIAVSKYTE